MESIISYSHDEPVMWPRSYVGNSCRRLAKKLPTCIILLQLRRTAGLGVICESVTLE